MRLMAVLVATALLSAGSASALTATFSGQSGAGETTIDFTGSSVGSRFGPFADDLDRDEIWVDLGDYVNVNDLFTTAITSTARLTVVDSNQDPTGSGDITGVYIDTDPGGLDDFGLIVVPDNAASAVSFEDGDTVSWTGSMTIAVDYSAFNVGNYTTEDYFLVRGNPDGVLRVNVIVTPDLATIPVPAPAMLLLTGLIGLGTLRARVRRNETSGHLPTG